MNYNGENILPFPFYKRRLMDTWRLLSAFRLEQRDPDSFYGLLANDGVKMVSRYAELDGAKIIDVGGGAGYFTAAFESVGANCIAIEPFSEELLWRGRPKFKALIGDGYALPFSDNTLDVTFSSNVLEHVERPFDFLDEAIRVTKKGGIVFACFTNWYSPWGGHETSPWHLFGGIKALERYEKKYSKRVKNRVGESLFPIHIGPTIKYIKSKSDSGEVEILNLSPRYYPDWMGPLVKLVGIREVLTWNLAVVLRKI